VYGRWSDSDNLLGYWGSEGLRRQGLRRQCLGRQSLRSGGLDRWHGLGRRGLGSQELRSGGLDLRLGLVCRDRLRRFEPERREHFGHDVIELGQRKHEGTGCGSGCRCGRRSS
jgi:hypothetical protein